MSAKKKVLHHLPQIEKHRYTIVWFLCLLNKIASFCDNEYQFIFTFLHSCNVTGRNDDFEFIPLQNVNVCFDIITYLQRQLFLKRTQKFDSEQQLSSPLSSSINTSYDNFCFVKH